MKKALFVIPAAAVLVLALNASAKERPGAAVDLELKDGRTINGELYAVKADAVITVDAQSRSTTTSLADIARIHVEKRTGRSVKTGAIVGGAVSLGLALGAIVSSGDSIGGPQAGEIAFLTVLTLAGAAAGGLVGWMAGGTSRGKTFIMEGLSGERLRTALASLRKYARAPSLR
jgi:hypothetical protein